MHATPYPEAPASLAPGSNSTGKARTIPTVSKLTRTTCPTSRTMDEGSSSRFGSLVIPLRLSVETWY